MPDWVFDTVALIDYLCGRPAVRPYFDSILKGEASGAFSTISEIELWQGIRPGEEPYHDALLSLLERVPLDGEIARLAGELRREFGLQRLSLPDAAVAATAIHLDCALITRNVRDFRLLTSRLRVEFYSL